MNFTEYLTKHYVITILVLGFVLAVVIPYPVEEVPPWKILMIDENYLPGGGRTIVQTIDNGYFRHHTVYEAQADKNGFVTFQARHIWAGAVHRLGEVGASLLGWDTSTRVTITAKGAGCTEGKIVWTRGEGSRPDKLVCP